MGLAFWAGLAELVLRGGEAEDLEEGAVFRSGEDDILTTEDD